MNDLFLFFSHFILDDVDSMHGSVHCIQPLLWQLMRQCSDTPSRHIVCVCVCLWRCSSFPIVGPFHPYILLVGHIRPFNHCPTFSIRYCSTLCFRLSGKLSPLRWTYCQCASTHTLPIKREWEWCLRIETHSSMVHNRNLITPSPHCPFKWRIVLTIVAIEDLMIQKIEMSVWCH